MWWVLPELVWHLEDLRVGMAYQNHYIARLASKFVKVALAGTGGDELFAGYPWRYEAMAGVEPEAALADYWSRLVRADGHASFFEAGLLADAGGYAPLDVLRTVLAPARDLDSLSQALYFEAKTFLHGLLVVEDRVSMAHSLEARVPFLDNELVEVARRIPPEVKHGEGGKAILRKAMRGLLPDAVLEKPKQGFSPPDESWYRSHSMARIRELLLDDRALGRSYFRPAAIRSLLDEHEAARRNHRLLIWSLLCFEWWNRLFVDGESPVRDPDPRAAAADART
jgi:asparagine synthase (glutamine-hydrolysing)